MGLFVAMFLGMGCIIITAIMLGDTSLKETRIAVSPNDAIRYIGYVTKTYPTNTVEISGKSFTDVYNRTLNLVASLQDTGIRVSRYRIVAVLLDKNLNPTSTQSTIVYNEGV